jgi:hypothetical protein
VKIKHLIIWVVMLLAGFGMKAQEQVATNVWNTLIKDIRIRYSYSYRHQTVMLIPRYGQSVQQLNGTQITLRGFFLQGDVTGGSLVLSYNPMNMCFFCTGTGLETVVELQPKSGELHRFLRLKTDDFIEVSGTLKLNSGDFTQLIYILQNAELKEIKNTR